MTLKTFVLPLFVLFLLSLKLVGVLFTQSFALEAETLHSLLDVGIVFIGMIAFAFGQKQRLLHPHKGYTKLELSLTLVYSFLLLFFVFMLFKAVILTILGGHAEIFDLHGVDYPSMRWFAILNLLIESVLLYIIHRLSHHRVHTLVVRGLFWHLVSDFTASFLTVLAAFWGYYTNNPWIDVVLALIIGSLLLRNALHLFFTSFILSVGGGHAPLKKAHIIAALKELSPHIVDVHHLHVDRLSAQTFAFTCHLLVDDMRDAATILENAPELLRARFGIVHTNLQLEPVPCASPDCVP